MNGKESALRDVCVDVKARMSEGCVERYEEEGEVEMMVEMGVPSTDDTTRAGTRSCDVAKRTDPGAADAEKLGASSRVIDVNIIDLAPSDLSATSQAIERAWHHGAFSHGHCGRRRRLCGSVSTRQRQQDPSRRQHVAGRRLPWTLHSSLT